MTRFLLALAVLVFAMAFVNGRASAESDADNNAAELSGPKTGRMIDQMMNQEVLADAASAIITAESALPKKSPEALAHSADMDSAVKLAMAKIPDGKSVATDGAATTSLGGAIDTSGVGSSVKNAGAAIENENQQPLFANDAAAPKARKATSSSQLWWRMISSLAVVLVVFGGGIYGFKKWPGSKKMTSRGRLIEVMSQHHLGPKRSLAVVRVAGEACLIGITDQNITILKTLSLLDDDIPTSATGAAAQKDAGGSASNKDSKFFGSKFQETLAATFTRSASKGPPAAQTSASQKVERSAEPAFYTRSAKAAAPRAQDVIPEDEFTMQGLREIVGEKLKSMREI